MTTPVTTFSTHACSGNNRVGRCLVTCGGDASPASTTTVQFYIPNTAAFAMTECARYANASCRAEFQTN